MKKVLDKVYYRICLFFYFKYKTITNWFYAERLRREILVIGAGVNIDGKIKVNCPRGLTLGNNVNLGSELYIDARAGVSIGDHTHISRRVSIYSTNRNFEGQLLPFDHTFIGQPVVIKEGVWIGMNVSINSGVTIGEGAILGMGATISENVEPYEIVVSSGQRAIGKRNSEEFRKKLNKNQVGGLNGKTIEESLKKNFRLNPISQSDSGMGLVFVLSTGRAGSKSLASILENVEEVSAFHEPIYFFLKTLTARFLCGKVSRKEVKEQLIEVYKGLSIIKPGTIYVESDQKLVGILDILDEVFPKAKYIWLIRNPYSFSLSSSSRGWFSDGDEIHFNSKGRAIINPKYHSEGLRNFLVHGKDITSDGFKKLSIFDRNILYWKIWNGKINQFFTRLPEGRKLFVRLEELDANLIKVRSFLELSEKIILKNIQTNKVKGGHKKIYENTKTKLNSHIENCKVDISLEIKQWYPESQ